MSSEDQTWRSPSLGELSTWLELTSWFGTRIRQEASALAAGTWRLGSVAFGIWSSAYQEAKQASSEVDEEGLPDERAEAEQMMEDGYYAVMHSSNLRWLLQMAAEGADVEELMVDFELDTVDVEVSE